MHDQCTNSPTTSESIPQVGFIIAAALADGDVIGLYRDGNELELRWVDGMAHSRTPITLIPADLPIMAKMLMDAHALLEREGEL